MNEQKAQPDPIGITALWRKWTDLRRAFNDPNVESSVMSDIYMSFICDALYFISVKLENRERRYCRHPEGLPCPICGLASIYDELR